MHIDIDFLTVIGFASDFPIFYNEMTLKEIEEQWLGLVDLDIKEEPYVLRTSIEVMIHHFRH
ncbi:MAG: hypothetical protein R2879_07600 [Saprospiraceae bacterium]